MSTKHTPGPWFVFGNGHCVGGPRSDDAEAIPTAGVAMCGMTRRSQDECAANARLIAAAPELLEALQMAVLAMRAPLDEWKGEVERKALDAARAAITKATGGAE